MEAPQSNTPVARDHYSYVTRSLIRLYEQGELDNVQAIDVEPNYGHVTRITYTNGAHRITYGNDLGLNPGAAEDLAKDKGHTKFMLRTIGITCPEGGEFLLPWWRDEIAPSQAARGNVDLKDTSLVENYIESNFGYPAYVKPVDGSKGSGVTKVSNKDELEVILNEFNDKRVRVAIVEEAVTMPDYRIVVLDGELISAYRRNPIAVTGDGQSTIQELIEQLQAKYVAEQRDTRLNSSDERFIRHLAKNGRTLHDVLPPDETIALADISNLSAGGTSEDVTDTINQRWIELASFVAKNFNLRLCGVDLACEDITSMESDYSVLEVNAAPGLDHYATSGEAQQKIVDSLYVKVFNAFPS